MTQINDQYFIVKNCSLKNINLMQNNFTEDICNILVDILNFDDNYFYTFSKQIFSEEKVDFFREKGVIDKIYLAK